MIRKVAFNAPYREGLSPAVSKPRKVKGEVHLRIDKPNTRDVSLIDRILAFLEVGLYGWLRYRP
jgi:hypothetical protein